MAGRRKNGGIIGPRRLSTNAWSGGNSTGVWDLSAQSLAIAAGLWPQVPIYEFRMVGAGGGAGQGYSSNYWGRGGGAGYTIFVTTFGGPFYVVVGKGGAPGSGQNGGAAGTLNQGGGGAGGASGLSPWYGSAAGGGFSGVFSSSTITQGNALAMAGGGGGGGGDGYNGTTGGYGGGTSGGDGTVHTPGSGLGGSQSAGGSNGGAALAGGDATSGAYTYGKAGGGGGYFGGGGAMSDGVSPGNGYGYSGGGGSGFLLSSGSDYVSGSMVNGVSVAGGNYQNSGAQESSDSNFGNYGRGSNGQAAAGGDGRVMWRVSSDGGSSFGAFTQLSMTGAVQTVTP